MKKFLNPWLAVSHMADDVIDPPADPAPATARAPKVIVCEFCDCRLAHDGSYVKMSDRAKEFRRQDEIVERLKSELDDARKKLTIATNELADLKKPANEKKWTDDL